MAEAPQLPDGPTQRHVQVSEDPHYHDDDEVAATDEDVRLVLRKPAKRKPVFRPPPRRFDDDR